MRLLVTGAAGFIGFHLARRLLRDGHEVLGIDSLSDYYDVELKQGRLAELRVEERFDFVRLSLEDAEALEDAVQTFDPDVVFHLAAQAGVRYSLEAPDTYVQSNIVGTFNLLEVLRRHPVEHLLMASTSSVYGGNEHMPFRELDLTDHQVSLYAATKKAGESLAHSYSHLFDIPTTCFRFFTVYGPWGRPDMALFKFVAAIRAGVAIDVYGRGDMRRDFTFVDDLVASVVALADQAPVRGEPRGEVDSLSPVAPFRSVNIAGGQPVELRDFIACIEQALGVKAIRNYLPMQPGDVVATEADATLLRELVGATPSTPLEHGVGEFVEWHLAHYR